MNGFPRLFKRFILRGLAREKVRTVFSILGIALGVAVIIAIRMANKSVTESFRAAVDSVSGRTSLSITGATGRFDELRLAEMTWLRAYGTASPVVETYAMVAEAPLGDTRPATSATSRGELLHVLGVDALVDLPIREYRLLKTSRQDRDPTPRELLLLLTDPNAIILTEKFARRYGKQVGDQVQLAFGSSRKHLTIRGLLIDRGPARALDGNFALMDIAAAQWACDRLGVLDRVDIKLKLGLDPDTAAEQIAGQLPTGLTVSRPAERYGRTQTMIAAFHFNLTALSGIALLVGLFLIHNTIAISVAARRHEIGVLQAVGAGRVMVAMLFLGEALMISVVGAVLGLALGQWVADAAVRCTAQTVETFYIAQVAQASARSLRLGAGDIALALATTISLALCAAAIPALGAAMVRPIEVIRGAARLAAGFRPPAVYLAIATGLLLAAALLTQPGPVRGLPIYGFVAGGVLTLAGAFFVPSVLWLACRAVSVASRLLPAIGLEARLAGSNLLGAIRSLSMSVSGLAVSLAMMISIAVLVSSFRQTVVVWLNSTLNADLFVKPTMLTSSVSEARMDRGAAEAILRDPDVMSIGWITTDQIPYQDTAIRLAATSLEAAIQHGALLFKSPPDFREAVERATGSGGVLISESLSIRFGKRPGDQITLTTRTGERAFPVEAVYFDYSSNQGTVMMDGETYRRHFAELGVDPAPSSLSIYLRPGAEAEQVRLRLAQTVGSGQDLYFVSNQEVRREAMRIFDSTFTITYALELIAIVVAGLGVISTLIALIYERQREIALLGLVGATRRQIRKMIVVEAVLIGAVSQVVGVAIGMSLAVVLIFVINVQSFGWTIQFHLPWWFLVHSTLIILAVTALCGLYPASRAANIQAIRVVREE